MKKVFVGASMVLALGTVLVGNSSIAQTGWSTPSNPYPNVVATNVAAIECPDEADPTCAIQYRDGAPTGLTLAFPL